MFKFMARWLSLIAFCGIAKKAEEKANQSPGTLVCDKRCMLLNGFFFFLYSTVHFLFQWTATIGYISNRLIEDVEDIDGPHQTKFGVPVFALAISTHGRRI